MNQTQQRAPVAPGEAAPDFSLPAVHRDGTVALADFKGSSPLLLVILRGLYCPFCRRALAQLSAMCARLQAAGTEVLAVVATEPDNARLYFRLRPAAMALAADPERTTHRAYGLPVAHLDAQMLEQLARVKINPTGELAQPLPLLEAGAALNKLHGFAPNPVDERDMHRQGGQTQSQFLLDRDGVVRWANIECATDGLAGFGRFPSEGELLRAIATLH